jgi:hypothetical protein
VTTARLFIALIEGPLVEGSIGGLAVSVRELGRRSARLQTGLVRTYAFAVAAGLAVLVVVFVAVR